MQILESSRPIMKCEHFLSLILHFQVDMSTQTQALGKSLSSSPMCVCGNRMCVCTCVVRASAWRALSAFVCLKACEGFNCGFPFYSVYAFFWRIGQTFVIVISF